MYWGGSVEKKKKVKKNLILLFKLFFYILFFSTAFFSRVVLADSKFSCFFLSGIGYWRLGVVVGGGL